MKKIAIILAIALLIAVFASCGKEETPATTTAADKPINTTAENKTTDAPKILRKLLQLPKSLNPRLFRILLTLSNSQLTATFLSGQKNTIPFPSSATPKTQ